MSNQRIMRIGRDFFAVYAVSGNASRCIAAYCTYDEAQQFCDEQGWVYSVHGWFSVLLEIRAEKW